MGKTLIISERDKEHGGSFNTEYSFYVVDSSIVDSTIDTLKNNIKELNSKIDLKYKETYNVYKEKDILKLKLKELIEIGIDLQTLIQLTHETK